MIAVITTFFNPQNYITPIENYWKFRESLGNCNFFCLESSFDGNFETDSQYQITANKYNLMWQKERALNLLIESLPSCYDKIIMTDCDLVYCDKNWIAKMEEKLDHFPVVQEFGTIHYLDREGNITITKQSNTKRKGSLPGGCWGVRLKDFPPLLDFHIVGGGDSMQCWSWRGEFRISYPTTNEFRKMHLGKSLAHWKFAQGKIGLIDQSCFHLYHGSRKDRQYMSRHSILVDHWFDPARDIAIDDNGLWRWANYSPLLHKQVAEYFAGRKEDL